jgi:hypothetical protein
MLNNNNKGDKEMKKVSYYSENFKYNYEFEIENTKFLFVRIKTTKYKDNYRIIYFDNTATTDQDYHRVVCCVRNLKQAKQIATEFQKENQ